MEIALAICCDIHPLDNLRVLNYLERAFGADESSRSAWYATGSILAFRRSSQRSVNTVGLTALETK